MAEWIIFRGAGDIATGCILRLKRCGYRVAALETEKPLAIRRTVALSECMRLGEATVEQEVLDALQAYASLGHLPRHIDPEQAECRLRVEAGQLAVHARADMTLAV